MTDDLSARPFYPTATIKCRGRSVFRSQTARDAACLFDVDPGVASWSCHFQARDADAPDYAPEFKLRMIDGRVDLVDVFDRPGLPDIEEARAAAEAFGATYRVIAREELSSGYRLQNARDLLRYGNYRTTLGDRVQLLRALDEHGTLTFAECMTAFRETVPVAGLASLILQGYLEVELDDAPLGPETLVRRIRD